MIITIETEQSSQICSWQSQGLGYSQFLYAARMPADLPNDSPDTQDVHASALSLA